MLQAGECPKCEAELRYIFDKKIDIQYYDCKCSECNWYGKEHYALIFTGYSTDGVYSTRHSV